MPDFNQYSPTVPFKGTNFSQINLSDVFVPITPLPQVGGGNSTIDPGRQLLQSMGRNPFANLGSVPAAPAGVTDYYSNQKFTSDSYNGGLFKDIGFLIGRDNETLWGNNVKFDPINTGIRLLDKVGTYGMQSVGFLAGLAGIDNKHEDYNSGSTVANWIAGAADNGLAAWGQDIAEDVDNLYRPIYQEAADRDKGFWRRMATDGDFWSSEVVDGAAFLGSAYATSNAGRILNLGGKAVSGISKLRGLGFANEALATSEEGLTGMSAATNLARGAEITAEGAAAIPNVLGKTANSWAGKFYNSVLGEAGNFANAERINKGVSTIINTASESLFESATLKNELADQLLQQRNADGSARYTPQEIKNITARMGKDSFNMNMVALFLSNLWEVNQFYGKTKLASGRNAGKAIVAGEGILDDLTLAKKTFGQRGLDYLTSVGKGVGVEGVWEENIQLAIERINKDPNNIDKSFYEKIGKTLNQYRNQSAEALFGNDPEASMSIGVGGLIGGAMAFKGHRAETQQLKRDVANFNDNINAFRTTASDFYKKDDEGKIVVENGVPVVDKNNVLSYVAAVSKVLDLSQLANTYKDKNFNVLHQVANNELFARIVKGYADNGMIDVLTSKLDGMKGFKPEDLLLMGLSPEDRQENITARINQYKKTANDYKDIYDNIEKNFFVKIKNDRNGEKAKAMKGTAFFLSTRAHNLNNIKEEINNQNALLRTTDEVYNSDTDNLVDDLNNLNNRYQAAKKRLNYLSNTQDHELWYSGIGIEDSNTLTTPGGAVITRPSTMSRDRRVSKTNQVANQERPTGSFVDVDELEQAVNDVKGIEKEIQDYVKQNEETLKNMQKGADGRYQYKVPEKNRLTQGLAKGEALVSEIDQARIATLNVFNRLTDIEFGEKYYDDVYGRRKQGLIDKIAYDTREDIDDETDPLFGPERRIDRVPPTTPPTGEKEEVKNDLEQELESLRSKTDLTVEEEARVDEIEKQLEVVEEEISTIEKETVDDIIQAADNIKPEDQEDYKTILNKIIENKKRVKKFDTHYEIDGQRYSKVTEIIDDFIPDDVRASVQNATNAGYTVDHIVKAYFDSGLTDQFRTDIGTKISEEAYDKMIKELDKIKEQMEKDGVQIVATNVAVFDEDKKIAGEIDVLGVDKKGNFKVYEVQARKPEIYKIYGVRGRGIKIRDLDQKRLSAYRNIFANQYGRVPNEIAVKFPFQVSYDKDDTSGFIQKIAAKKEIRFQPTSNVQVKRKVFEPVRVGSKFDNIDLDRIFTNAFLSQDTDKAKLQFLFRNVPIKEIKSKIVLTVKKAAGEFQERFNKQKERLEGQKTDYKLRKYPGFDNLYSLVGNMEFSLSYEGTPVGYLSPAKTLAYKDEAGVYQILDENVDEATYKNVTGNSSETFGDFKRIASSYKSVYDQLVNELGDKEELKVDNARLQQLFDIGLSYGELDLVKSTEPRPLLKDLVFPGIKIGGKDVVTVVNIDETNSLKLLMDKNRKSKAVVGKFFEVDKWANTNQEDILKVITANGRRVTDFAGIIELPNGDYRVIALRKKGDIDINVDEDFIDDLGSKFTAATKTNVFKNENITATPKFNEDNNIDLSLDADKIAAAVYKTEDINELSKNSIPVVESNPVSSNEKVTDYVKNLDEVDLAAVNAKFAAFPMSTEELILEILDDYQNGEWASIEDYLEQLGC